MVLASSSLAEGRDLVSLRQEEEKVSELEEVLESAEEQESAFFNGFCPVVYKRKKHGKHLEMWHLDGKADKIVHFK